MSDGYFGGGAGGGGISNVVEDTTPQLGGDLDANGNDIIIDDTNAIRDENSNEQIVFSTAASAVNHFQIGNAAAGFQPTLECVGDSANVSMLLQCKGTGVYNFGATAASEAKIRMFEDTSNGSNYVEIAAPAAVTSSVTITVPDAAGTFLLQEQGFHPGYRTGVYYGSHLQENGGSTFTPSADTLYFIPFRVGYTGVTIDAMVYSVSTAQASTNARVGIYNNSSGQPSTLLSEAGEGSLAATGEVVLADSETLTPGYYWLAVVTNSSTAVLHAYSQETKGNEFGRTAINQHPIRAWSQSHTYGALPASASGLTQDTTNNTLPDLVIRVA